GLAGLLDVGPGTAQVGPRDQPRPDDGVVPADPLELGELLPRAVALAPIDGEDGEVGDRDGRLRVDGEGLLEERLRGARVLVGLERLLVDREHEAALDRDVVGPKLSRGLEALARLLDLVLVEQRL